MYRTARLVQGLLTPFDGLNVMPLPIFREGFKVLEVRQRRFYSSSLRHWQIGKVFDEFGICFGVGKKKTCLRYLISNKVAVGLRPHRKKLSAQLFVTGVVLRFDQKPSVNGIAGVVSRTIFKDETRIV